jgi:hypothetical protein
VTAPTTGSPPPGVPPAVAQHWPHLPWRVRQQWRARLAQDVGALRAQREARYRQTPAAPPPQSRGARRTTAETARLVQALTAQGLTPPQIVERLGTTASAIESALRRQDDPDDLRGPYQRMVSRLAANRRMGLPDDWEPP